jgi:hypothetical protein
VTVLRILAEVLRQALTELVRQPDRTLLRPAGVSHTEGRREAFVAAGQRTGPQAVLSLSDHRPPDLLPLPAGCVASLANMGAQQAFSSERVFAPWAAPCFFRPIWYA